MDALPEPREFEKVPGHWRCLRCSARLEAEEKPECPACGPEGRVVGLSWKLYGSAGHALAEAAQTRLSALDLALQESAGRAEAWMRGCVVALVVAGAEAVLILFLILSGGGP